MLMSVQLKIWKRLITNQPPLSSHHQLFSRLRPPLPLPFISKPHITFPNFCSQIETPSTTPPERGVVTEFFLNKCGLSEKDIARAFRRYAKYLLGKSTQNFEEVLELLNGCGLTRSDQIRKVVLRNPKFFFYKAKKNVQPKLTLLQTFMTEEDISKLLITDTWLFDGRDDIFKSAIALLQGLGFEDQVLSELVVTQPRLLRASEEKLMVSFKQAEVLGFKKGSKTFADALRAIWRVENVQPKLTLLQTFMKEEDISKLLISDTWLFNGRDYIFKSAISLLQALGFEGQVLSELVVTQPRLLRASKEKLMLLFKQAEDLGFKKGSKAFAYALLAIWRVGKQNLERTLQFLRSLGLSEEQIWELSSRDTRFLELSEENLKSTVDFMVKYVELPLSDLLKHPLLFTFSLEKRIIPRYRVMEELTCMQGLEKIPFVRIFYMTEKRFLNKYVKRHAKSSILQTIYYCEKDGKFNTDK